MRIQEIRGIQLSTAEKLRASGLKTAEELLLAGKSQAGRKELAAKAGIDVKEVLELVNRADLARVKGIAGVYSDLLEHAGVDTVKELATLDGAFIEAVKGEGPAVGGPPETGGVAVPDLLPVDPAVLAVEDLAFAAVGGELALETALEVTDDAGSDTGTLTAWSISISTMNPCATGSACPNNPSAVNVTPDGPLTICLGTGQTLTATPAT